MSLLRSFTITITVTLIFTLIPLADSYGIIVNHPGSRCSNESRDVNSCLHRYIEKDYPVLSIIMYPHKSNRDDNDTCQQRQGVHSHSMIDGPILESTCRQLHGIYDCLSLELPKCDQLNAFFNLRHLLYSLRKILRWLCGLPGSLPTDDSHQEVRSRFKVLLESAECLECMRTSYRSPCYVHKHLVGDSHLWLKILRLQIGPVICHDLKKQLQCVKQETSVSSTCGSKAKDAYWNITSLFMFTWCDQHPLRPANSPNVPSSSQSLVWILCLLCVLSSL